LDGLEYDIVHTGDFPSLKQIEYGKVRVPITEIGEPSSPIVWVSFVTGEMPDIHGVVNSSAYQNTLVNTVVNWLEKTLSRQTLRRMVLLLSPLKKILKNIGILDQRMPSKNEIKVPTLFSQIESSLSISVPVLNVDVSVKYNGILDAIIDPTKREEYVEFLFDDFESDKNMLFKSLNKFRVIMCHFQLPDLFGHIYCRNRDKISSLYKELDEFISVVKTRVSDSCWVLIVSDHGIDKNFGHTHYGFYSSNKILGLDNPHIVDFFPMIMREG